MEPRLKPGNQQQVTSSMRASCTI